MPSVIALIICSLFVFTLLWIDHHRYPRASKALWIVTIWMLYCGSRPIPQWFSNYNVFENESNIEEGSLNDRILLTTLIISGLFIIKQRRLNWRKIIQENRWLFILYFYMLISLLWSDFPFVSLKRWIKTFGPIVMATLVYSDDEPLEAVQCVFRRLAYILIPFSLLLVKYYPRLGVAYGRWSGGTMWIGVSMTKNTLGSLCMIIAFFLIWRFSSRWKGSDPSSLRHQTFAELVLLGQCLWLLKGPGFSFSATSIFVLIACLVTYYGIQRLNEPAKQLSYLILSLLLVSSIIYISSIVMFGKSPVSLLIASLGRDETLTGRTTLIWNVLIPISWEKPILGVGYGAFWIEPIFDFPINQAHNGYLDVFIELGGVGIVLLVVVIFSFFKKVKLELSLQPEWGAFRIAILLATLLHNITETTFLRSTALLWNVFVFGIMINSKCSSLKKLN